MTPIADASDAAGSIRVPAAFNGLVGLKPSRGRITLSPNGVDLFCGGAQVHCVSRTVRDSAAFLDVTCGGLTGEPYVLPKPETLFLDSTAIEAKNLKIGFTLSSPDGASQHREVSAAIEKTLKLLESSSRDVQEFDLKLDFCRGLATVHGCYRGADRRAVGQYGAVSWPGSHASRCVADDMEYVAIRGHH